MEEEEKLMCLVCVGKMCEDSVGEVNSLLKRGKFNVLLDEFFCLPVHLRCLRARISQPRTFANPSHPLRLVSEVRTIC